MKDQSQPVLERKSITVVMPAYNAAHLLPRVLAPLLKMRDDGEIEDVLVVDDCSPDNTAEVARNLGARVIVAPVNGGPGAARNLAANAVDSDILWLVDSDVIAWPDGADQIRTAFAEPNVRAVFGSYDNSPDGTPWFSRYKNLTHRFYHQRARREAQTFWAGCGAVDRAFFLEIGGFDVETYKVPSIEDIELGYRIRSAGGRILLLPTLQGKHLKVWTMRNAVFTDIFRRALPWSRLMIAREGLTDDLNTGRIERLKAAVAGLLLLSLVALPFAFGFWPITLGLMLLALALNWPFARFLYRNGGFLFTVGALLFHQIYFVYSTIAFAWCLFEYHILGRTNRLHVP